jgi:NAD(P)-dependent dehydrogenase (short-subunit alcohol dehydrogenase family)
MSQQARIAVITGASRGLGAGMAHELARRGLRLGLCARTRCALPNGGTVLAERLDVADGDAVEAFASRVVDRFGRIDLWINNAGLLEPIGPLRDLDGAAFRRLLDVNVLGVFHGTRAFARHVRAREGEGVLVNISSGAAQSPYAGWSAYCASKAAVERLTECVQLEEAEAGLRAYAIAPGIVDTEMQQLIRSTPASRFPAVGKFVRIAEEHAFNTPAFVAEKLLEIAFDPAARPDSVAVRLPQEGA